MKIFISYRRADSQTTAGRMAQFLDNIPPIQEVFLDVDGIEIAENFEQKIQKTLAKATHVFVLIGPQWKGPADAQGRPRIFDPDDVVRWETRMSLDSNVKLVPILLDEASMPHPSELPQDLGELLKINAFSLRTPHFDEDMDALLDVLLGAKKGRGSQWRQAPLTRAGVTRRMLIGLACGAVILIGLGFANRYAGNGCYDVTCTLMKTFSIKQERDALGLLLVIIIAVLALGVFAPFVPRMLSRKPSLLSKR